ESDDPETVGHTRNDVARGLAAPDDTDDGVEYIVHEHGPPDDITRFRVELLGDIRKGRAGARINARHAAVADGREEHRNHCNGDGRDNVPVGKIADDTVDAHRRRGLDDDDAVDDQVPQLQGALQLRSLPGSRCDLFHRLTPIEGIQAKRY